MPVAATALLVAVSCYLGSKVGLALRFPPATPSVMWPPNAILTATLLLAPPRRWPIYLLAALPAHLFLQPNVGWPVAMVTLLFATNCSEALAAAILVRRFSDAPTRFDTLARVAVFIGGAVLLAPFVSSFADAAVVATLRGEPYWLVWRMRFFSNTLTALTLVPAIVIVAKDGAAWMRGATARRILEAAALALGAPAREMDRLRRSGRGLSRRPGLPASVLPLGGGPLRAGRRQPLAARDLGGGHRVGGARPGALPRPAPRRGRVRPADLPHHGRAADHVRGRANAERHSAERALKERLHFEELLSRLSGAFVHPPSHEIDQAFPVWLGRLGEFLRLDEVVLLRLASTEPHLAIPHAWRADARPPAHLGITPADLPWTVKRLQREQLVAFSHRDELPPEAARDLDLFRRLGIAAALGIPLVGGRVLGALIFKSRSDRSWPAELVQRLRLVAEVLASALARQEAELEAQRSRQELAHFTRVSTMGELASSLAHQLNQPLTAILANAEAASLLLKQDRPDLGDLEAILADVIEEDKRAGNVIRRMRELLRKGALEREPLDVNAVVRDVVRLLSSDALIRKVSLELDLSPQPLVVGGDRIQLQQVVLNLLVNALETTAESASAVRNVLVQTSRTSGEAVQVSIIDQGPGLGDRPVDTLFEPSYTTKPADMGMGLSIARSIVEAHDGTIGASNNVGGGATFQFVLPLQRNAVAERP